MALTGHGSEKEQDTISERLKRLEQIIYKEKLYVKCPVCKGMDTVSCLHCNDEKYFKVEIHK